MLIELAVRDLGVIADLRLALGPGLIALTGETGAGKTMVVEAIDLLVGGRSDPMRVRAGAHQAEVEGLVVLGDEEHVVRRVVPRQGRSRAYIDGRLATATELAALGRRALDLHGQHAHQSLLGQAAQRAALDRFGKVDRTALEAVEAEIATLMQRLQGLGGDERARAREIDVLRFQVEELDAADLSDPHEDAVLEAEEELLGAAAAYRDAALGAVEALSGDEGVVDGLGVALASLGSQSGGESPFEHLAARLRGAHEELMDVASELRVAAEGIEEDPDRLDAVSARRQLLRDLRRKYGETLAEVIEYRATASERLQELASHEERAAQAEAALVAAHRRLEAEQLAVRAARQAAAGPLAASVQAHLAELAMAGARLAVEVPDEGAGEGVTFVMAANSGAALAPLSKVASGGELARTMLALRLVLTEGPPTLVFDEVDAGIGGAAAVAVGHALRRLGADRQVLVVTHLPQVAAAADVQLSVVKHDDGRTTTTEVLQLDRDGRVVELSRMLSGTPDSEAAREHASELLQASERSA